MFMRDLFVSGKAGKNANRGVIYPVVLILLLIGLLSTGCAQQTGEQTEISSSSTYEVAPVFREFYAVLGGETVLGPAISQRFSYEELTCQYTANALLCQDPLKSGTERFLLYPLGRLYELFDPESAQAGEDYGVYEAFQPMVDRLSGERYAGEALSGLLVNPEKNRVEQYFENVGFYSLLNDPRGDVKLLAYGAYACDDLCDYAPAAESIPTGSTAIPIEQPFLAKLKRSGLAALAGQPLGQPYKTADGALEQVYMNVVVFSPEDEPDKIFLRPIAEPLGMTVEEPQTRRKKKDNPEVFYETSKGKGFYVPLRVDRFIRNNGGRRFSGDPLSNPVEIETGVFQQCFDSYCLLYLSEMDKAEQVRVIPLGLQYLQDPPD